MSVRLMADVFEHSEARGGDRLVLLVIADEADDDGRGAYPGYARLAHKARLAKSTVRDAVDRLEALGELRVIRPASRGRGHVTHFEVTVGPDKRADPAPSVADKRADPAPLDPDKRAEKGEKGRERADKVPLTCTDAQYPRPNTQDPIHTYGDPGSFEAFWAAYPRRSAKGAARKAWPKALRAAGGDPSVIVAGAERFARDPNRVDTFTPHASTWLNAERWSDPPLPAKAGVDARAPRGWSGIAEARAMRGAL